VANEGTHRILGEGGRAIEAGELPCFAHTALCAAGVELARCGDKTAAAHVFAEAIQGASKESDLMWRETVLAHIVEAQARADMFCEALSTAQQISRPVGRDSALSIIIERCFKEERDKLGESIVARVGTGLDQALLRVSIAVERGLAAEAKSHLRRAYELLPLADRSYVAGRVLENLLKTRIALGDLDGIDAWFARAFAMAGAQPLPEERQFEYRTFGQLEYRVPNHQSQGRQAFDKARAALAGTGELWTSTADAVVGAAALDVDDLNYAALALANIRDDDSAEDLRIRIARKYAERGDARGALTEWVKIRAARPDSTLPADKSAIAVIQGFLRGNNGAAARILARQIKSPHWRGVAIFLIARAEAQRADEEEVLRWVQQQDPLPRIFGGLGFVEGAMIVHGVCGHQYLDAAGTVDGPNSESVEH
jgi:hypothetical protein